MYKRFLFVILVVFSFIGCSSQKYLIRKVEDTDFTRRSFETITDSLSLLEFIQLGYFEKARDLLSQHPDSGSNEFILAEGMLNFYYGRKKEAEQSLLKVFKDDRDSTRIDLSFNTLYQLYLYHEKFDQLEGLINAAKKKRIQIDSTSRMLSTAHGQISPYDISFKDSKTVVPMLISLSGCPTIKIEINNQGTEIFWLDTGAGLNVISSDLAQKHGIHQITEGKGEAGTATDKKVPFQIGFIESIQIGDIVVKNVPVMILDSKYLKFKPLGFINLFRIDGVLGWPLLSKFKTTLNYPQRIVCFEPISVSEEGYETRNFFWYGVPFVEIVINSLYPMNFFLDTGANKSSLTPTSIGKINSHSPKLKSSLGCTIGAGGGKFRKIQKLERATITIDKFNISSLTLSIHEDYNEYIIQKDGTLGGDILKNFIVTLDPVRGRFILKYLSNDH